MLQDVKYHLARSMILTLKRFLLLSWNVTCVWATPAM